VRETHEFLRQEIGYLQQAAYCIRLIEQATETETPLGSVFEMLKGFLEALPTQAPRATLLFGFELKLLGELGLTPDFSEPRLTAGARALIRQLEHSDWAGISRLRLNPAQQAELQHFLHGFLLFHLGQVPKGRDGALEAGAEKSMTR
jgi:recombinational DNA repair protein (RecF pathway)